MRIPAVERLLAVLGYVPFLWFVPIVGKRDSIFCQFHGRQAGVLWGLWIIPTIGLLVAGYFLGQTSQGTPGTIQVVVFGGLMVIGGLYLLMSLVGMYKSLVRERYRMPVVADVALFMRL